jgi:hypothetical protein
MNCSAGDARAMIGLMKVVCGKNNRPAKGTFQGEPDAGFFVFSEKKTKKNGRLPEIPWQRGEIGEQYAKLSSGRSLLVANVS